MANLKYWLWLANRKGLAGQNLLRVLQHFGSPEGAYFSDPEEYRLIGDLPEAAVQALMDKSLDGADRVLGDCDRLGIRILTMQDAAYPERLAAIHQPPPVLYWKGRPIAFDEEAAIAIVGTRNATPYGVQTAAALSMELTRNGALVVSGMAQGIDAAAVRGALRAGGSVVSVLAGGIDVVYPRQHRDLYADVAAVGALISEHPPGTEHRGAHFPVRNRVISGLSVGVVAVESGRVGGTLLTVNHALEQDREVFAVPGPWNASSSEGTNRLIQEGAAKLILCADDVLCEFTDRFPNRLRRVARMEPRVTEQRLEGAAVTPPPREPRPPKKSEAPGTAAAVTEEKVVDNGRPVEYIDWKECKSSMSDDQQTVLLVLAEGQSLRADDIVERTQVPARRVLSALTVLQLRGYVTEESGKRFRGTVRLKME